MPKQYLHSNGCSMVNQLGFLYMNESCVTSVSTCHVFISDSSQKGKSTNEWKHVLHDSRNAIFFLVRRSSKQSNCIPVRLGTQQTTNDRTIYAVGYSKHYG